MSKRSIILIVPAGIILLLGIILLALFAPRKTTLLVKTKNIDYIVAYYEEPHDQGVILDKAAEKEFVRAVKKSWYTVRYGGQLRCENLPNLKIHYKDRSRTEIGPTRIIHYRPDGAGVKAHEVWVRLAFEQFRPN